MRVHLALAALLLLPVPAVAQECAGQAWVESTLYMGRGQGNAGGVTDDQVRTFVDQVIVPAFPDGFTLYDAHGFWRDGPTSRTASEKTLVFVVVHPSGDAADKAVRSVAQGYAEQFHQQVVLGSSQPSCVTFYERTK